MTFSKRFHDWKIMIYSLHIFFCYALYRHSISPIIYKYNLHEQFTDRHQNMDCSNYIKNMFSAQPLTLLNPQYLGIWIICFTSAANSSKRKVNSVCIFKYLRIKVGKTQKKNDTYCLCNSDSRLLGYQSHLRLFVIKKGKVFCTRTYIILSKSLHLCIDRLDIQYWLLPNRMKIREYLWNK